VEQGAPQQASAKGPGQIDLVDKGNDQGASPRRYPINIIWKKKLTLTKDGKYDLFTLTGGACFLDKDHQQQLAGKRLQVWLEPAENPAPPATAPDQKTRIEDPKKGDPRSSDNAPRQRPHRLEAFENVSAHSPEMNINKAVHLTVYFEDPPPGQRRQLPTPPPAVVMGTPAPVGNPAPGKGEKGAKTPGSAAAGSPGKQENQPPKKPINLAARSIVAFVTRLGPKNDLKQLLADGEVRVDQEAAKPGEKGVKIRGESLDLKHNPTAESSDPKRDPRGDILTVWGAGKKEPAKLELGELFLQGPKVTIDQQENTAVIEGIGTLTMPSNSTLEGGKPTRSGTRLKIHWNECMVFDGKEANFSGGVQAFQENSRLRCRSLQVTLDRRVSLREGQQAGRSARVDHLVSDQQVEVDETVREKGKLKKFSRLVCGEMVLDNVKNRVDAKGPGVASGLQFGAVDNGLEDPEAPRRPARGGRKPRAEPREEMKLTRVEFEEDMITIKSPTSRKTTFFGHVRVLNVPSETADVKVDIDRLPARGMYISCEELEIASKPHPQIRGKSTQEMVAKGGVRGGVVKVLTPEYQATAATVKFDEAKDLVIFEAGRNSVVHFYKLGAPGAEPKHLTGKTILYNRKTRATQVNGANRISTY
jgi:hypothetical protein